MNMDFNELKNLVKGSKLSCIIGKSNSGRTTTLLKLADEKTIFVNNELTIDSINNLKETLSLDDFKVLNIKCDFLSKLTTLNECYNNDAETIILDHTILNVFHKYGILEILNSFGNSNKKLILSLQSDIDGKLPYDMIDILNKFDVICYCSNVENCYDVRIKEME